MKKIGIICLLLPMIGFAQNETKAYSYKTRYYNEGINLNKDGTFKYTLKTEFTINEILGNWQLRNDSILVLDSHPQKSKLNVYEDYKKGKKVTFIVRDSEQNHIGYSLHVITDKKDTIVYKNQFDKSVIMERPVYFYVVNKAGLHSPIYKIRSKRGNYFSIRFEQQRIFENEQWKLKENKIIPIGLDGKYSNYVLELMKE